MYRDLPSALVNLSVLESITLHNTGWDQLENQEICNLSRAQRFACITTFESGYYNLDAFHFIDVVAVSSGNNLYVSELLLSDPASTTEKDNFRCFIGNIGRPGIKLLLLTKDPDICHAGLDTWDKVNHSTFDGSLEDNFGSTSVHLNLTGDEVPLNVGKQGACDKDISYFEAVVRVYEQSQWVADINILNLHGT